ncbi:MAG: bifunctional glutamate N-acetyltransferase/amino-acid acetyltransferase ArgJ [Deltaproteobacteria bacterium]|nr:bifunctional glutamate N-acetyltransferase/amino-acid acetyltransferase ArgJ [Deltaproteobacteria bacterium]
MMKAVFKAVPGGTVTSPEGFFAGAVSAGINERAAGKLDLAVLFSETPCVAAGVFTTSKLKSAPVQLTRQRLEGGKAGAVVVNSGCANAFTGEHGLVDAAEVASLVAEGIGIDQRDVLVASTGVIGVRLPMKRIRPAVEQIIMSRDGGHDLAKAMMTTDTLPKETAVGVKVGDSEFTIGGAAKGSGMIHPDMATLLCFLTTDAAVETGFLKGTLKKAVDASFNMISVDGDTSPSDTVLLLANGMAGGEPISAASPLVDAFRKALERVCVYLAKLIAADGEGATRLIEVVINGAASVKEARQAARAVVSSALVKAAIHGADPNWGRVVAAVGRSGADMDEYRIDLYLGETQVIKAGRALPVGKRAVNRLLKGKEINLSVNLNLGKGSATAWGCDLSEEYVAINSEYMT